MCSEIPDAADKKLGSRRCTFHEHAKQEQIIVSLSCRSAESPLPNIFARTCRRVYGHMPDIECSQVLLASVIC